MSLQDYGWSQDLEQQFQPHALAGLEAGRVVLEHRNRLTLHTDRGEIAGEIAGRLARRESPGALPVIGDWVAFRRVDSQLASIQAVLPRRSKVSRNAAGRRTQEQVVAANLDTLFLVMGLDGDFNLRRLERFLVTAYESGAEPIVVLNKADLEEEPEQRRRQAQSVAPGVPVVLTSCARPGGTRELESYLGAGTTVALLGSSGVGKSSLINRLSGRELLRTGSVRQGDDRGRHTTTHRQLVALPNGALLIDNPGIRELQLWSGEGSLETAFDDLGALAADCRFRDCTHRDEPGCAVRESVEAGDLDPGRLRNYRTLEKELQALELRRDRAARKKAGKRAQAMIKSAKWAKARDRRW